MYAHEQVKSTIIKTYEFKEIIGEGVSSRVYKAFDNKKKINFAIKVIPKLYLTSHPKLYELVKNEISILKACNNPNVIKCQDVFQSALSIFIVTELCNSLDLQSYLAKRKRLTEDHAVIFLKQILNGFKGLHSLGCMHRDFKSANILIKNQNCKIADLGFAKKMKETEVTYTMVGTYATMAPEVLEEKGYGFEADVWSLGVVFYQMIYGEYPFMGINKLDLLNKIKNATVNFSKVRISWEASNFIERCLTYDPNKRLTWAQIYKHDIINKKRFQLLYSFEFFSGNFEKNVQFYTKENLQNIKVAFLNEKKLQTPQQQSEIRESLRKKLIIEQIRQIVKKKQSIEQQIQELEDVNLLFEKYAQQYIFYFNKLSCVFKFAKYDLVERSLQKINKFLEHCQFTAVNLGGQIKLIQKKKSQGNIFVKQIIYILYKKAYCQLLQFSKILQTHLNIFKIPQKWTQFKGSDLYSKMSEVIHYEINRCKSLLFYFEESACLSSISQISAYACEQSYDLQKILIIKSKWLKLGIKSLLQYLKLEQTQQREFLDFMEGILYTLIGEDGSKMRPEDFDLTMEQPKIICNKKDLIQRFDIYFDYMI